MSVRNTYLIGGEPALFEEEMPALAAARAERRRQRSGGGAPEGGRNNAAFKLALDMAMRGVPQDVAVDEVVDAVGLPRREVLTTVASAYRREGGGGRGAAKPRLVRPPQDEVVGLWEQCLPVGMDAEAVGALRARGVDPAAVEQLDLARVLPKRLPCPAWLCRHGVWLSYGGHRLLFGAYDSRWQLRSVRCRWVQTGKPRPKTVAPIGVSTKGLVLANAAARAMVPGCGVVVVEGEMDWLEWSIRRPDLAVIGVVAGAWTNALAQAVPAGCQVAVRVHSDEAGRKYRDAIVATLGHCSVFAGE